MSKLCGSVCGSEFAATMLYVLAHKGVSMNLASILEAISQMSGPELQRVREAVERRRERLKQSTVLERRSYGSGILQLELRANPKTATTRGPYWYFHYREEESSAPFTLARPTTRRALWPRSSAGRAQGDEASHEHRSVAPPQTPPRKPRTP